MGSFDPMEVGRRKNESSRPPFIVSMSPPGYPSAWLRPRSSLGYRTPNEFAATLRSSLLHG
jgi:hypothetical protein